MYLVFFFWLFVKRILGFESLIFEEEKFLLSFGLKIYIIVGFVLFFLCIDFIILDFFVVLLIILLLKIWVGSLFNEFFLIIL